MNASVTPESAPERESQFMDSSVIVGLDAHGNAAASPLDGEIKENPWGYGKRLRFIRDAISTEFTGRPRASVRVLDVGCGNGSLVAIPLARYGFDVTGVDFHESSIEHGRRLAAGIPNVHFIKGTATDLVAPSFDAVILSEVLEHVSDPKALLMSSLRHVKRDGIVLITVPNGYGEFEIDSWIFRTFRLEVPANLLKRIFKAAFPSRFSSDRHETAATDNSESGHVQFFRRKRLKGMFGQCSLDVVKESAGSFMCGPIAYYALGGSRRFIEWNVRVADKLPLALVSSWYFVLRRTNR